MHDSCHAAAQPGVMMQMGRRLCLAHAAFSCQPHRAARNCNCLLFDVLLSTLPGWNGGVNPLRLVLFLQVEIVTQYC